mmetsp:Transcript_33307/g.79889  ORF Transcript_33307/g.79889 Transcript_33307/m.79889 type:complete len:255 (-) Transcript_33307:423-1187(-)
MRRIMKSRLAVGFKPKNSIQVFSSSSVNSSGRSASLSALGPRVPVGLFVAPDALRALGAPSAHGVLGAAAAFGTSLAVACWLGPPRSGASKSSWHRSLGTELRLCNLSRSPIEGRSPGGWLGLVDTLPISPLGLSSPRLHRRRWGASGASGSASAWGHCCGAASSLELSKMVEAIEATLGLRQGSAGSSGSSGAESSGATGASMCLSLLSLATSIDSTTATSGALALPARSGDVSKETRPASAVPVPISGSLGS